MSASEATAPRDGARPTEHYHAFVAREQEAMSAYTSYDNPALFGSVAPKCVRIGLGLYSAGSPVSECVEWFGRAATYQHRFMAEGAKFSPRSAIIDEYLEIYSAAFLAGKSGELVEALKKSTYGVGADPAMVRLLDQFCDLLQDRPVETSAAQAEELASLHKPWAYLPPLFSAASTGDAGAAASALDDYLLRYWGPQMEREAKRALKSPQPEYWGRWSLFSAACCRMLGHVPEVSKKAGTYIPVELVNA